MALRYASNNKQKNSYQKQINDQKFAYSLPSRLESLNNDYNKIYSSFNSRFFDKDGNFVNTYGKTDNDSEYEKYAREYARLQNEITEIESFLSKDTIGDIFDADTVSKFNTFLSTAKSGLSQMESPYKFYSDFHTEYDYNDYIMNTTGDLDDGLSPERIAERTKAYKANSSRIAELNDLIDNFKFEREGSWEWSMSPDSNVPTPKYVVKAKNQAEYDALVAEKAKLEEYNTKYKRGMYDNDTKLTQYRDAEDYAVDSQNRDFYVPTIDELYKYMAENDTSTWSQDKNGNYVDKFGTVLEVKNGNIIHPNEDKYKITDPLGVFLSAEKNEQTPVDVPQSISGDFVREYNKAILKGWEDSWSQLREEEIGLYYYFLNNDMEEQALSYLEGMATELNRRENNEQIDYLENEASALELVAHNVLSVPANIIGGAGAFVEDTIAGVGGKDINPYGGFHSWQNYAQNTRGAISNDLNEWTGNGTFLGMSLGDTYQAAMSGVDSIVGAVTLGKGYTYIMGMGAASSKAKELYEQGASNEQIAAASFLAGAAEAVFEKVSIDHFLNKFINAPTLNPLTAIWQSLLHGGIELSEETATELSNIITDSVVLGSRSDWEKLLTQYKEKGYSDKDAIISGILDMSENVWKAGASGFISGVLMGGGGSLINLAQNNKAHNEAVVEVGGKAVSNETVKDLVDIAKNLPDSKANAKLKSLANEVAGVDVSTLSENEMAKFSKKVGKLYESIQNAQMSEVEAGGRDSLNKLIKSKLNENGITDENEIENATKAIVKMVYEGKALSKSESELMEKVGGKKIANYLLNNAKEVAENINATTTRGMVKIFETETLVADNNLTEGKSIPSNENVAGRKFDFNLDGQTINTKTGDTVKVSEIASIEDGKMTLKLENGETVDADDISFGTRDEAIVYSAVLDMGVNAKVADSLVKNFKAGEGITAQQYALGIKEAYKYGMYSIPEAEMSKKGFAVDLNEAQRKHAYNLGKINAIDQATKAQAKVEKSGISKDSIRGKVHFSGDALKLDAVRRESLNRMNILSDVLGVDFYVFESYMQGTNRVYKDADGTVKKAPNGYYKDGKIYIDLNAGKNGEGVMIYTVAHELTHFIKEWSPAKFKILADFLMEQYGAKDISVDDLVKEQIAKAKRNGRTIDYATAYEEVVADSMETMLSDDNVLDKIMMLKSKDESIIKKIGEFFEKLLESFKKLMQQYTPNSNEGKLVAKMTESLDKIQSLFAEALVDASDNYQANKGQKNTTSEGDVIKFSLMNRNTFESNVDAILSMSDEEALLNAEEGNFIRILDKTPHIITDNVKDAENLEVIISFYSLYLAARKGGALEGHYHNLGDLVKNLPEYIANPQAIVKMNSGRLNLFTQIKTPKGANGILSIELNSVKDINNKFDKYNLVITVYSANDNHTKNNIVDNGVKVEYEKEDLMQVNPQLCKWLAIINKRSSKDSIPQTSIKSQEKQSARENAIGERNLEDFAEAKDTDGNTLFQYRAMESDEDIYRKMLKTSNIMNDTEIDALFDTVDKAMDIIKDNLEILDYAWDTNIDDRAFSPVKKNTDKLYQVSVDFSTLCRKRLLQQTIQAHLQDALNRPLSKNEGIAIRDALMTIQEEGKKIEIACALCYVESARMKSPAQIKRFVDDRETVIKNHFAAKSDKVKAQLKDAEAKARKRLGADDTPLTKLPSKMQKEIRAAKKEVIASYVPSAKEQELIEIAKGMSVNDFVTPKGLENLIKQYPDLFEAYASYIVNATHSKGIENDTWWRAGDSNNIGDTLIANMNAENGLRSQSWSDFQVIHLLDYIAATIELSARKAKMQAYTKVPDFVELMGNTGEMINLSLIPTRHFNGALEFDSVEGMAFEESLRLRDKYHATTGTIAIGVDNVQIQMLLDSMDIDYVIPYHRSGMSKAVRKAMHIPTWDEYENHQSEKNLSREDARRQAKKYGVKLLAESDANYQKHPNFSDWFDIIEARQIAKMENSNPSDKALQKKYGVMYGGYMAMQNAANNYLKLCAERGISPKFSYEGKDFTVEDNYWKLLIDRKMVDNVTGAVIEQQAVKPIFDQGEVLRILNDELERYPTVKADQDYAIRKVAEHFLSGNIKGGMSAEAIAKAMKTPVDNIAKVNILASVEGDTKLSDRETYTRAKKYFGTTTDFEEAGFILPSGEMLRFTDDSHRGERQYDHRAIGAIYGVNVDFNVNHGFNDESTKHLVDFVEGGGIRFDPGSLEFNTDAGMQLSKSIPLTTAQEQTIRDFVEWKKQREENYNPDDDSLSLYEGPLALHVDFGGDASFAISSTAADLDAWGVKHLSYEGGQINADRIIADIRHYYRTGETRQPSKVAQFRYSERVTDEETLDFLNEQIEKGEYITVYRSFQVIDGGLYAPMNAVDRDENGKNKRLGYRSELGVWEKSTESPEIAQRYMDKHPNAKWASFDLDGVDNKTDAVAYNPYLHASNLVLNDQFAAAYRRNLVTVECRVPISEVGAYHAKYAKDTTGWVEWKPGGVAGKLMKVKPEYTRKLFVSRYMIPVRIIPDSEVANMYKEYLDGTDIAVPWNVVTPGLRKELVKAGVKISYKDVKGGNYTRVFSEIFPDDVNEGLRYQERDDDAAKKIEKINKQLAAENVKLIEDVKYLKELVKLQSKETHGKMLKKSTVELVAKRLMAYQSAKGNTSELVGYLTDVYNYIIQGDNVSWEGIQEKSQAAVDWLMNNEYHKPVREDDANEVLKHLRTMRVSLDDVQKAETAHMFGSYDNFRKKNMGRVIFANDAIPLDSVWQELADLFPGYFDRDVNSADQPIILMEIIDGLQNSYIEDEHHYYSDDIVRQDLMTKIYEGYWDVSALHTVADAKQKEINLLKAKHNERMEALRESHRESDAKLRQEHKAKITELRTQYREREERKIQKVAEYYQKSRKEAVDRVKENREKRDAITKLQKLVLDTAKWVSYPAKDAVKCPDIIRGPYAEFLKSIDLTSKRALNGGEPTKNDLRVASAMDSLAKAIEKKLGTQSPDTETDTVLDTGYLDLPVHFVENLKELAESLKQRMETDGHIVNSMTSDEIKALTKFIRTLNHSIKEMSTLYANMRFARVEQLGNDSMVFLKDLGEYKKSNSIVDFVTWDNALPYYTFKRFGVAGESVFEELMDAQDKHTYLAEKIFKFAENTWTGEEANEWSKDTHTIELPSGRKVTLTSADAMSIYCLSRREQGRQHLLGGGVRVLGIEKNGKKASDSRSLLNLQDLLAIADSLSERQRKVAESIQEFMSTVCSEWGNEISMKRFLTKEFTENFYFPIESNDENLDTKDPKAQQSDLYRLLNISATKPLVKGANNEVIIRNIFDVFANHSSDMAKLNAYGMALLDYMKWINYREKTVNDDGQISVSGVRKSMEKAYGPEAKKYVIGLIKDINGRYNDNGDNKFLMKMLRGAKTAMVGANLRVAALQVTAYPRAAMVLSSKSLTLGLTKVPQIEKAKKYCGIALRKSFGFYDTNISRSLEEQFKGATNIRQKLIELSLKGAEWGDAITWGALWNACEYEVAKTKKYKVGSEEFNQAVGKKLREVVYATQVVDSTLTRSQMMRSKSGLTQTASAFMSEPTLSANILMDAAFQFNLEKRRTGSAKVAWQKTSKYVGKAVAVYSVGQIFAALAEALMDAYRDDDEEEFKDKFGEAFKENAISDLNPFNKIPIIADFSDLIMSWFGIGFSSSNSLYLQAIDEASNAFDTWSKVINGEDGKTVYSGIYSTTKLLSYITGVSASGTMREVVTLWNNTAGAANPYLKIRTYESSATDKGIAEYSFDKGDTASVKTAVSKMVADKVKSGKTEKEAKSSVRASFTSTYKAEYMAAVKAKDYDEMNRIRKFLYATGLYGTLSELDKTLESWRKAK